MVSPSKLNRLIEKEFNKFTNRMPSGDGTVIGAKKRMVYVKDNSGKFQTTLNSLSKEYISNNNFSDSEIEKLSELTTNLYVKFMRSYL